MTLRNFSLDDYEEVVDMYYAFNKEVFGSYRKITPKYFYYKAVQEWINKRHHIVLSVNKDNIITGFSVCYIDEFNSLTEPVYNCEICYVKPKYRNTRASYLLFNNGYSKAKELKLNVYSNGRIENKTNNLMSKHFGLEPKFINMEGIYNG